MGANKYDGKCRNCGEKVPAGAGLLGPKADGKWTTEHREGECGAQAPAPAAAASDFTPTAEQQAALDLFLTRSSMVIEAGAGTGKTATLKLLAEATNQTGQYIAFNKAIVGEAEAKFPANVACNTAHSLAYRAVITPALKKRLEAPRMNSDQIARVLRINPITVTVGGAGKRTLAAGFLAGRVMAAVTRFCQSAELEPERKHFPYIDGIDLPDEQGRRTFANNDEIAGAMLPFMRQAWSDLQRDEGALRFNHDHYLKMWQLSGPRIDADFILFDEAQDANPVMAAIVAAQTRAQLVYVGDSQQSIYEFTGAVNTLGRIDAEHRVFLTQSFRFGPEIAEQANEVLAMLDAELRLQGTPSIRSRVGLIEREDAILHRTNAGAVKTVLALIGQGRKPHLVGGGGEVVDFAKAARELMENGHTGHSELACFDSWGAVQFYVQNDAQGGELRLLVNLVDDFGVDTILAALDNMASEAFADTVVSTAHKAKGREWDRVRLGDDFPTGDDGREVSDSELRLAYVAITRARLELDCSSLAGLFEQDAPELDNEALRWADGVEG